MDATMFTHNIVFRNRPRPARDAPIPKVENGSYLKYLQVWHNPQHPGSSIPGGPIMHQVDSGGSNVHVSVLTPTGAKIYRNPAKAKSPSFFS